MPSGGSYEPGRATQEVVLLGAGFSYAVSDKFPLTKVEQDHDPGALVFTAPEGGPLRVPAWRRRHWAAPAIEASGLAPLRPHDLRHTAVALWIASGADPLEVSRRAGHASTSFTQDRYGHLFTEADSALADRLARLVPSSAGTARAGAS